MACHARKYAYHARLYKGCRLERDRWRFAPTAPMQLPARGNRKTGCGKRKLPSRAYPEY
jgi:hypothetical protein